MTVEGYWFALRSELGIPPETGKSFNFIAKILEDQKEYKDDTEEGMITYTNCSTKCNN